MKKRQILFGTMLGFALLVSGAGYAQTDQNTETVVSEADAKSEDPCWCKDVVQNDYTLIVHNLDSIAAANPDRYQEPECKPQAGTCPGDCELKTTEGKVVGKGVCTDEAFGSTGDVPPGPGEKDCDCIFVEKFNNSVRYTNVTIAAQSNPNSYVLLPPKCDDACETRTCQFVYKIPHGKWDVRKGYCSGNWPGGGGADASQKSTELLETEAQQTAKPLLGFFPNPTNDVIIISGNAEQQTTTRIFDLNGKLLIETAEKTVDLGAYAKGIYLIKISGETETFEGKIVRQ